VGQAVGRGDPDGVTRAGHVATALGIAYMSAMTLIVIVTRHDIAGLFFGDADAGSAIDLTATLLLLGATFFVADGIQTVVNGALRGLNDTRIPLLLAAFSYWIVGFTAAYALAFPLGLDGIGVWIGLSVGTALYAGTLMLRFMVLSRRFRERPTLSSVQA
jgi:MATE family multidrug resistance protein